MRFNITKRFLKLLFVVSFVMLVTVTILEVQHPKLKEVPSIEALRGGKWRQVTQEKIGNLSNLGRIMYFEEPYPNISSDKIYKILVWKYGNATNSRHILQYGSKSHDIGEMCSVKNCRLTYNDAELPSADIVIVHLHRTQSPEDIPPQTNRNPKQIWAFSTDESPYHTFLNGKSKVEQFNGVFNWSLTYRMDSDIPVPYGRTILKNTIDPDYKFNIYSWLLTKKEDVMITMLTSNCNSRNHRSEYVKELQKHIKVDVYGKCGTLKCPGFFNKDCQEISKYMFYLTFENSNCNEYITEKLWWNAYHKNAIPILMGAPESTYKALLPPYSYIHVDQFASPRDLANYLMYLNNTPSELERFFEWKKYFKVLNEHGYFGSASYHYCRVCEALNYNDRTEKVYNDLAKYWSVKSDCYPAWDQQ